MKKYQDFLSENVPVLVVKFSMYLNRCVFSRWVFHGTFVLTSLKFDNSRSLNFAM